MAKDENELNSPVAMHKKRVIWAAEQGSMIPETDEQHYTMLALQVAARKISIKQIYNNIKHAPNLNNECKSTF